MVEVGGGSGLDLPFYRPGIRQLYAVDPSEALLRIARRRSRLAAFEVEFLAHRGEALADAIVRCLVFFSVPSRSSMAVLCWLDLDQSESAHIPYPIAQDDRALHSCSKCHIE